MKCVIAAIDLGPRSKRVLYHAAGFARLWSLKLSVVHVVAEPHPHDLQRVREFCLQHGPYEIDVDDIGFSVVPGIVSDAILRESFRQQSKLVVLGSRGRGRVTRFVLGSTCEAVLRGAQVPVLLVPPTDIDIVNITDRTTLTCGPVLAAVDLLENCDRQLLMANDLAWIADRPLLLMTVAPQRLDERLAGSMLRERGHHLGEDRPYAFIVRRGEIADEISRCARKVGSGLVVMGLRSRTRFKPGAIASAVLDTNRAFVLAVPAA
jgi:nucleotide-binding universal stress UspA family protein